MIKRLYIVTLLVLLLAPSFVRAQVTKGNLDQNADQGQGNYAPTNLNYLNGGKNPLGMMQNAWKDPLQHMGEGQTKPGYTKYYWSPDTVFPIRIREGMYTLINFPQWEIIENIYLGDATSFEAKATGPSSLMITPNASQFLGVDTNMVVFGRSGNKYVFYVQSETVNTDRITNAIVDIEVLDTNTENSGGMYGSGTSSNSSSIDKKGPYSSYTSNLQREDWIEKIPVDPTKFRFDIEVYVPNPDDIIIAPERVWRDNIFTYIDLGDKALTAVQRPIVTLIVERSETPVGFRAAGPNNRLIIVEGMGDMVLRSGKRMVCLKLRRADSDGLENAVYAKTNEWDEQNRYASQLDAKKGNNSQVGNNNEKSAFGNSSVDIKGIEDVYGLPISNATTEVGVGGGLGTVQNNASSETSAVNDMTSSKEENSSSFFSKWFGKNETSQEKIPQGNRINAEINANNNTNNNNLSVEVSTQSKFNFLDELPKAMPIVESNSQLSKTTENTKQQEKTVLTGEVTIKDNKSELITPEYNNQTPDISVSVQKEVNSDVKLSNDPNPVLITPKFEVKSEPSNKKTLLNAETEALLKEYRNGKGFANSESSNISIELGTDENVNNLVRLWDNISKQYSAAISKYEPFYSVDTPADGQGKEVFHLRVGPVKNLEEGDNVCSILGRNGIFCSVVRIQ